jgi:hypothetical protein
MANNIVPENIRPSQEQKNAPVRVTYRPDETRRKLGKYFINEPVSRSVKDDKMAADFFDHKDLEEIHQKKEPKEKKSRKRNFWGKKILEEQPRFDQEDKSEIEFVGLVKKYHDKLNKEFQDSGELLENHSGRYLDSLSVGILYKIYKDRGIPSLKHTLNFPQLLESEQYKTAYKTALLALAEESLDRMNGPSLTEIDTFQKYLAKRGAPQQDLSDIELRNYFVKLIESHPTEFLKDYYVNYRFTEDVDALRNSRNTFKLGEIITEGIIMEGKISRLKAVEIETFLPYEDNERNFDEDKQYWRKKTISETRKSLIRDHFSEALHGKNDKRNRSEQALLDLGVLRADKKGGFTAEGQFIKIFADYFENDAGKPERRQNQMVLGMLYNLRGELGVGVLPDQEVLRRANEIIPSLKRAGEDLLRVYIDDNFQDFYQELGYYAGKGMLGEEMKREYDRIFGGATNVDFSIEPTQKQGESDQDFANRRLNYIEFRYAFNSNYFRHQAEVSTRLVNSKFVDGFKIGEGMAHILKKTGEEKMDADTKNIKRLDLHVSDENAAMKLLIEGEQIEDPAVRARVEATMKKTSRLWKFTQRTATRAKIAIQNKLFYTEGESPFLAKPSLATEVEAAGAAVLMTSAYGHFVNHFMEDPVNRGVEAAIFMGGYFIVKEGGAIIREIAARKKAQGVEKPKGKGYFKSTKQERKEYRRQKKEYKVQVKSIKKEVSKDFWHNKGKLLYSTGSYILTSVGVNYLLKQAGLSGDEAPMVLAATNMAVSGLLSAGGMRSGAEFVVNSMGGKKVVDGGIELLAGKKQEVKQKKPRPEFHFKHRVLEVPYTYLKNKAGRAYATNIAPRIERAQKKIVENKVVKQILNRHDEENRQLQVLEKFVNNRNNPNEKLSKEELIDVVEFLTWMKEEEGILLIHNPRYYSRRKITRPDGTVDYIDNKKGLSDIDRTRKEVVDYAQKNLPKEEYDEVMERSLDFFADIKSIREKVRNKRIKYLVASYGYRAGFMIISHALANSPHLLEKPIDLIFGDANSPHQQVIETIPTEVFHANAKTPEGQESIAKEVFTRMDSLNNLANLLNTSKDLVSFQPGLENHLEYWGVNQAQMEGLVDQLKAHNMNTADLMRFIYVLSSYKEGQEYLSTIPGLDGTDHKTLTPLIVYLSKKDPYVFMNEAVHNKKLDVSPLLSLKYPDLAQKFGITDEKLSEQVLQIATVPESEKAHLLSGDPIVITEHGSQVIAVGNIASEFVDGIAKGERQSNIDFLLQMKGILEGDRSMLQEAVNFHYTSFLADTNNFVDIANHSDLTAHSIGRLPAESIIYKVYQALNPQTDAEITKVVALINKAKNGDVNSYAYLAQLVVNKDPAHVNNVFDSQINTDVYDRILNGLPGDPTQGKEELVRRIQMNMISMGLRPISGPIINIEEWTALSKDPDILTNSQEALGLALTGKMDLEMAVSISGKPGQIFIQNGQIVGKFDRSFQINTEYSSQDLGILNSIEGSESEDNQFTLPKMIKRNISYLLGQGPASGATPPAASLIEKMTGGMGQEAMNPDAPSVLHNYDKYGPDYLTKLIIAHFRGRIPEDLVQQMGPNADLTESLHHKDPTVIDRLCFKFESLIAGKALTARLGEDEVHKVFLNHVDMGTINGVEVKGVEAASQVLFNKSFRDLTVGEKFLIEALGQSPNEYLYDIKYDGNGHVIGMEANPAKAITHAIYLIQEGKAGEKLDIYVPGQKEEILKELKNMETRAGSEGWQKVFTGGMKLPVEMQNFVATPGAAAVQGMSSEQIHEAMLKGDVTSVTMTPTGQLVITLKEITTPATARIIPDNILTSENLSVQHALDAQLTVQYSALTTDMKLEGDFYTTTTGVAIPAWHAGPEFVVPGMAIVEIGPDGAASVVDPTNTLSAGPQLFGSSFKPLIVYSVLKLHPELNLGEQQFNSVSTYYQGQFIQNSAHLVDNQGTLDLRHALSASANVPMVDMWTKLSEQDPNLWHEFQQLAKNEFGIHFYELKDGKFIEVTSDPFVGNAALPVGNIFVGGETPKASGMMQMAEFYQKLGEMSVKGDPSAAYVTDALSNDKYKADVDIWGFQIRKYFDGVIAKTGSQQGFDPVTGQPMAIRNIVAMVKVAPDGKVSTTMVLTGGIKPDGKPTELGWGSEFLPVARNVLDGTGPQVSPQVAQVALNELFINPESGLNYHLGAVSTEHFYPLLKDLSSEDQYAYLREAIRTGGTKYLFVDLVGAPHNNMQTVAIHLIDKTGENKLITLNVSANLIEPAGSTINHFAEPTDQAAIFEILTKATQENPERFGGLLTELKTQGINFIPIHSYESSPALFTLHEQMVKNHMLFAGAEDAGSVMKQLGLDPRTTVFVNSETFDLYRSMKDQNMIAQQIFAQREYLALAAIYESSGSNNSLDKLLYTSELNSNEIYQLLKVFIETKTSQTFVPVVSERSFLVNQFQHLVDNPELAKKMAPDVIAAYNLYNTLSSQIARGEAPDPVLSKQFIEAVKRFPETTNERTLLSLGIGVNPPPPVANSSPLPQSVIGSMSGTDVAINSLKLTGKEVIAAPDLINNFLKHPESFSIPASDIPKARVVVEASTAIVDIINSKETLAITDNEQRIDHIVAALSTQGYEVKRSLVSQLVYDRQCVNGNLVLNNILVNEGLPGFVNMEGHGGENAKSFAGPLIDAIIDYRAHHPDAPFVGISTTFDHLFMKTVDEIPSVRVGDTLIISAPWLGDKDVGHIAQVLFTGTHPDGSPYMLVYDTNGDSNGTTTIREIDNFRDFISEKAWSSQQYFPGSEPIYVVIRPEDQVAVNP